MGDVLRRVDGRPALTEVCGKSRQIGLRPLTARGGRSTEPGNAHPSAMLGYRLLVVRERARYAGSLLRSKYAGTCAKIDFAKASALVKAAPSG